MRRHLVIGAVLVLQACSGDDTTNGSTPDASSHSDATSNDATSNTDTGSLTDASSNDAGGSDSATTDAGTDATSGDAACPSSWTATPTVDPSITVPADGGGVLIHASAAGTQNYTCKLANLTDGGTAYQWVFVGPEADLSDCHAVQFGKHFASDAGATAPEWMQTSDGSYVIGKKVAAFDGGASSVPWLLLQATSTGGTGTMSKTAFVQRLNTDGGISPTAACDQNTNLNMTEKVNYSADYYFYGTP